MKSLSQIVQEFVLNFHIVTTATAKIIFKYLKNFGNRYHHVFSSLAKIAEDCQCSIKTVQRAIQLFKSLGWLEVIKRPYQSNVYWIPPEILALDLNNPKTFTKEEALQPRKSSFCEENVHPNVHVLEDSIGFSKSTKEGSEGPMSKTSKIASTPIQHCIADLHQISDWDKKRLSLEFPEYALLQARQDVRQYLKWGRKLTKPLIAMLWTQAKDAMNKLKECLK